MARTKKDAKTETPVPAEEQVVTHGEGADIPQTDTAAVPDNISGGLSDLELAGAATLDPDAPLSQDEQVLQTDFIEEPQPGDEQESPLPQTDSALEAVSADTTELPQTDFPIGDGEHLNPEQSLHPQTDFEGGAEDLPLTGESGTEEGDESDTGETPPLPTEESDAADQEDGAAQTDSGQPQKKLRMPGRRGPRVVSIDAERTVETDTDRLRSDLLDLVESLKSKKILTGTIQGVERLADNPEMSYAVTYHGDYKVIIPVLEAVEEPADYRDQPRGDVLHYLLNKRLGAEVDYVVKGIDQQNGIIAASRLEAMALKRREYYFRTDREGNYQIYEGIRAEARVVSVIRAGIFVDLFGAECYIPLRELSYQRWVDASAHYQPGQRVLVKVLEVDRSDHSHLQVSVSVKQAGENPYEKALKKFSVGSRYVGTVSMVDLTGVFVSLDGGIDCLCTYPKRGRPPRGCRVTVRILGIDNESNRIWGVITHMSTAH